MKAKIAALLGAAPAGASRIAALIISESPPEFEAEAQGSAFPATAPLAARESFILYAARSCADAGRIQSEVTDEPMRGGPKTRAAGESACDGPLRDPDLKERKERRYG
jgi:hypothetical protein